MIHIRSGRLGMTSHGAGIGLGDVMMISEIAYAAAHMIIRNASVLLIELSEEMA